MIVQISYIAIVELERGMSSGDGCSWEARVSATVTPISILTQPIPSQLHAYALQMCVTTAGVVRVENIYGFDDDAGGAGGGPSGNGTVEVGGTGAAAAGSGAADLPAAAEGSSAPGDGPTRDHPPAGPAGHAGHAGPSWRVLDLAPSRGRPRPDCVVCLSEPRTVALLPCRHLCACEACFGHLDKCPVCRADFTGHLVFHDGDDGGDDGVDGVDVADGGAGARADEGLLAAGDEEEGGAGSRDALNLPGDVSVDSTTFSPLHGLPNRHDRLPGSRGDSAMSSFSSGSAASGTAVAPPHPAQHGPRLASTSHLSQPRVGALSGRSVGPRIDSDEDAL